MQKLINVVALLSGLTSLGLIGGSAYLLLNKDALIDQAKSAAAKAATEAVAGALPGIPTMACCVERVGCNNAS